jgi:serine/threonine protein kinase
MSGGYSNVYTAERIPGGTVCVKAPMFSDMSLISEALVQVFAAETLESLGIHGAVPKVYDIFNYAGETRFSMEYIKGQSLLDFLLSDPSLLSLRFLQILAQIAYLLFSLQTKMRFDHRDLKVDNIWIRETTPVEYSVSFTSKDTWILASPFQVVLLDFGFSCIGNEKGRAVIHLSEDVLPAKDQCPKEGRDLFQFLVSLWSLKELRERVSPEIKRMMEEWLSYHGTSYESMSKDTNQFQWTYLAVSDPLFRYPPLNPRSFLEELFTIPILFQRDI